MAKTENIETLRHSTAHILAYAVTELFPDAKPTIGPAVKEGFYYDFDKKVPFTPEDLEKIERRIYEICKKNYPFEKIELDEKEANKMFAGNKYKLELIKDIIAEKGKLTAYKCGDFVDLCRGPHVEKTGLCKAFKLTKISSAYWKGKSDNASLQRVYGIVFPSKDELKEHLRLVEEAEKRDHRKIGKEMELFSIHEEAPGMPFFHHKGTFVWNTLVEFMRGKMRKLGYQENKTPIILNKSLWLQSGHWDHYKENMYFTKIDEGDYAVKPMNCPGNLLVYKSRSHSYRELPIKAGEFGLVHRHELSGVLSGLFRVRAFTQDDAHVFCMEEQLQEQIIELINLVDEVYKTFGFEYHCELSTMPEKAMGSKEIWDKAESILKDALEKKKMKFKINPGDGAFYGPKIDYHLKDAIGRTWQCGTIQLDFSMPEKFDLTYEGSDGSKHRPVMLHRAIYGSIERFLGILIEHYAGKFPMWISPVQARVLTITDRQNKYAETVVDELKNAGLRVEIDTRAITMNKKIREAQLAKVNYILVVGDKELESKTINIRTRDNKVLGAQKIDTFIADCMKEIEAKK
jgi:threonyl-tRNA synthetase